MSLSKRHTNIENATIQIWTLCVDEKKIVPKKCACLDCAPVIEPKGYVNNTIHTTLKIC